MSTGRTSYLTIGGDAVAEIEVKRSRFLARARRVEDEASARAFVEQARKDFWDARHHCSAFVLGPDAGVQRSSDDGEPAGTAGMPMLEVLRGAGLSDTVVVVTRWFGGVLLGTGGLVRAYSDAVRVVLEECGMRERALLQEASLAVGHADAGRVEHDLRFRGVTVTGVEYVERAVITVAVSADEIEGLTPLVDELTAGSARLELGETRWVDLP